VVEKLLRSEGLTKEDLGRDEFARRVWAWRREYGGTIIRQLKSLGCACDYERERFSFDEGYVRAVTRVFVALYEKGYIYKDSYIVNWCPRCGTAISDAVAYRTCQDAEPHPPRRRRRRRRHHRHDASGRCSATRPWRCTPTTAVYGRRQQTAILPLPGAS
jgi:hypothetical protein